MPVVSLLCRVPRFEHRQSAVGLQQPWPVLQNFGGGVVAQMAAARKTRELSLYDFMKTEILDVSPAMSIDLFRGVVLSKTRGGPG